MQRLAHELAAAGLALAFMTRLPLPGWFAYSEQRQQASVRYYPLAGIVVGLAGGLVFVFASSYFEPLLSALLAVASVIVLTGALHEDGFADLCDALGGAVSRDRALEIMRDSRIGTYGVVGLSLLVAAKVLALAEMPAAWVPWVMVAAHAGSRAAVVAVMSLSRYVRTDGAASSVAPRQPVAGLLLAGGFAALALVAPPLLMPEATPSAAILTALAGLAIGAGVIWQWFQRRLGGYTGDCLGSVQQGSETGLYLAVAALY